ncbi:hypothetical protein BC938DRAFT_471674 [Jimgerdemannia flammicorona]|uniref:Uncharacterized protein n=1 Tax=Jimgerdemannia flammicorona TaxID=994334 RepID=A0A433Q7P3_9FUNG|nr:hypothetical protein BC938DRAFT_471674 [Jimgerdemannia flammicorona]
MFSHPLSIPRCVLRALQNSAEAKYQDAAHDLGSLQRKLGDAEAKVKSLERERRTSQQVCLLWFCSSPNLAPFTNTTTVPGSPDLIRAEAEITRLRSECDRHATAADDLERHVRELERERARLQAELADRTRERDDQAAALRERDARVQQVEAEVARLRAEEARTAGLVTEWRTRVQALEREKAQEGVHPDVGDSVAGARAAAAECSGRMCDRYQEVQGGRANIREAMSKYDLVVCTLTTFPGVMLNMTLISPSITTALTKTLAAVETELREASGDRVKLLREIKSTRELAQTLDRSKDELQNQVRLLSVENEKLQSTLRDLHRDNDDATNDLRAEQLLSTKATLEHQLQTAARQQTESTDVIAEELAVIKEDNRLLTRRIDQMQREILLKETELITLQVEYRKTQDRLKRHENHIRSRRRGKSREDGKNHEMEAEAEEGDPTGSSTSPKSEFERKLVSELEKTRQQMRQYEVGEADSYIRD